MDYDTIRDMFGSLSEPLDRIAAALEEANELQRGEIRVRYVSAIRHQHFEEMARIETAHPWVQEDDPS